MLMSMVVKTLIVPKGSLGPDSVKMKEPAETYLGRKVNDVVVTVPACS